MITLFGTRAQFGLPDASPFVTKTEIQLRMAGLDYEKVMADRTLAPKGQLPWIEDDGELIGDSTFIRAHLERKYGVDFDEALSPLERAQAWAIERMLENQFWWTVIHFRWLSQENFDKGPGTWFAHMPGVGDQVQGQVRANVLAVGVGRHAEDEIVTLGEKSLAALSMLLGDKPYLMGARPCGLDATALATLAGLLTPHFDSPLRRRAQRYANLLAYTDRLMGEVYPEFDWTRSAVVMEAA